MPPSSLGHMGVSMRRAECINVQARDSRRGRRVGQQMMEATREGCGANEGD